MSNAINEYHSLHRFGNIFSGKFCVPSLSRENRAQHLIIVPSGRKHGPVASLLAVDGVDQISTRLKVGCCRDTSSS
jgi:hypothetical protein